MKDNYNQERFDEAELISWMEEIIAHTIQELGHSMADFENNQFRKKKQKFIFQKLKEKLVIDQSINKIWQAVEDKDLVKINSIKQVTNYNEFLFKLGIIFSAFALGVDSSSIEFLLHNTEISSSKFDALKDMAVCTFTDEVFYDEQLAKQLLASMDSSLALDLIWSIQHKEYITDESLINLLSDIKDLNRTFLADVSVDGGDTFVKSETTLLSAIIFQPRLKLIEWLINNKAVDVEAIQDLLNDTDISDDLVITFLKNCKQQIDQGRLIITEEQNSSLNNLYFEGHERGIDVFEALISCLKVDKNDLMNYTTISVDNKLIKLGDCWDIFHLKNSLSEKYIKFKTWISNPDIHSIASLFNVVRSSLKQEKKTFEDENANELQDIHIDPIACSNLLDIEKIVKGYFIANWHKGFLITKDITQFYVHLRDQDGVNNVGEALFESYKHDGFKLSGEEGSSAS